MNSPVPGGSNLLIAEFRSGGHKNLDDFRQDDNTWSTGASFIAIFFEKSEEICFPEGGRDTEHVYRTMVQAPMTRRAQVLQGP